MSSQDFTPGKNGVHVARLFASTDRLVHDVADFAREGIGLGEGVILILERQHRQEIARRLDADGADPDRLGADQLIVVEVETLLSRVLVDDIVVNEEALKEFAGKLIARARSNNRTAVRIYGESVMLLHRTGREETALRLEEAWNELIDETPVQVLCGYLDAGLAGRPLPAALAKQHQRVQRDAPRERLVQAARALFVNGYESTSTAAISAYAGSSESQLIKHFGSKEGLLRAVFENWWQRLLERIGNSSKGSSGPRERLDRSLVCLIEHFRQDPGVGRLMLFAGWRFQTDEEGPIMTDGFLRFRDLLDSVLDEASDQGRLEDGVSPHVIRDSLVGAVEGLVRNLLTTDYDDEEMTRRFDEARLALSAMTDVLVTPESRPD